MNSTEFKKDFIESIKTAAAVTGEGSCASFVDNMAQYLIDAEVYLISHHHFIKAKVGIVIIEWTDMYTMNSIIQ